MDDFRFAVAGAGHIAHKFVDGLKGIPGMVFAGAASHTPGRAESFVDEYKSAYPHARAYLSYEELALDVTVDAVYVANLNTQHAASVMLFLRHGKPVLCEKPFALNAVQASEMIACAKENNVFLMEAMWTRFLPVTRKVIEWVREGRIGEIFTVSADFGMELMTSADRRTVALEKGGGALLDLGIYPISYLSMLFGHPPTDIKTICSKASTGVDASFDAILKYGEIPGPFSSKIQTAHICVAMDCLLTQEMTIAGTEGMIRIRNFWMAESASLYVKRPDGAGYDEPAEVYSPPELSTGYQYEAQEVMRLVRAGEKESRIMPLDETLTIMQVLDDMRKDWGLIYPDER